MQFSISDDEEQQHPRPSRSLFTGDLISLKPGGCEVFGDDPESSCPVFVSPINKEESSPHVVESSGKKRHNWKSILKQIQPIDCNPEEDDHKMTIDCNPPFSPFIVEGIPSTPPIVEFSIDSFSSNHHNEEDEHISDNEVDIRCRPTLIPITHFEPVLLPPVPPPSIPAPISESVMVVEHIILIVHGVNGSPNILQRNLEQFKESLEQIRLFYDIPNSSSHVEMINWKSAVIGIQSSIFEKITP